MWWYRWDKGHRKHRREIPDIGGPKIDHHFAGPAERLLLIRNPLATHRPCQFCEQAFTSPSKTSPDPVRRMPPAVALGYSSRSVRTTPRAPEAAFLNTA